MGIRACVTLRDVVVWYRARVLDPDYKQDGALVTVYLEAQHDMHLMCWADLEFGGGGQPQGPE